MSIAGLFLLAGSFSAAVGSDGRAVPRLERALDAGIRELAEPRASTPVGSSLEDELATMLLALERLDRESALARARALMRAPVGARLSFLAHRVAARSGDVDAIRAALNSYFDEPARWRRVLGDAAAANDDVRLRDFLDFAALPAPPGRDWLRTTLLRFLGDEMPRAIVGGRESETEDPEVASSVEAPALSDIADIADILVTMYQWHQLHPNRLPPGLAADEPETRERAQLVMALSGQARRLPLLIDLAVSGNGSGREAAFRALAEMDLGEFDKRLHRLAGDPDREVRFQSALALVPTGELWALRLLVAELDESSAVERQRTRRALERLSRSDAIALLGTLVSDGTATPFSIELYLDWTGERGGPVGHRRLWELLSPYVAREDPTALLAAARLDVPEARREVRAYLDRR